MKWYSESNFRLNIYPIGTIFNTLVHRLAYPPLENGSSICTERQGFCRKEGDSLLIFYDYTGTIVGRRDDTYFYSSFTSDEVRMIQPINDDKLKEELNNLIPSISSLPERRSFNSVREWIGTLGSGSISTGGLTGGWI